MWVAYPAAWKRSAIVTSSSGSPQGADVSRASNCIPVRNVSRPVIKDAYGIVRRRIHRGPVTTSSTVKGQARAPGVRLGEIDLLVNFLAILERLLKTPRITQQPMATDHRTTLTG